MVDLTQAFNRELITVHGLAPGYYQLRMHGEDLGSYSAEAFAKGVNIAVHPASPQQKQSLQLAELMDQRAKVEAKFAAYANAMPVRQNCFCKANGMQSLHGWRPNWKRPAQTTINT